MSKLHDFIFEQGIVGLIGCLLVAVSSILCAIIYPATAANVFNPEIYQPLVILFIVSAVVALVNVCLRLKEGRAVSIILAILCLVYYGGTQANYLANLFTAIDPTPVSASLVLMFVFSFLNLAGAIVSFVCLREKNSLPRVCIDEKE